MVEVLSISEQLAFSTLRIECTNSKGQIRRGTGFFFNILKLKEGAVPAIITNKHVVMGAQLGKFLIHCKGTDGAPDRNESLWINANNFQNLWLPHPDESVDLCVFPIGHLLRETDKLGKKPYYIALDPALIPSTDELGSLSTVEDILMVGYPNGIWDAHNNMPIMRRGITATHPAKDYEGRQEFMIDAACFPGSSGSPVLLYNVGTWYDKRGNTVVGNRVNLLGILYAGPQHIATGEITIVNIPTVDTPIALSSIPNNLGMVIKAKRILEFQPIIERMIGKK